MSGPPAAAVFAGGAAAQTLENYRLSVPNEVQPLAAPAARAPRRVAGPSTRCCRKQSAAYGREVITGPTDVLKDVKAFDGAAKKGGEVAGRGEVPEIGPAAGVAPPMRPYVPVNPPAPQQAAVTPPAPVAAGVAPPVLMLAGVGDR
ncbi:MAG: hypothetical protein HY059_22270 [Proteobacteria bacterium]|nr:hypothetical protein [Pseudomonadota bacterium]